MNRDLRIGVSGNAGLPTGEGLVPSANVAAEETPVLSGAGVTVKSMTDFGELLATLKMETEVARRNVMNQSFAATLNRLAEQHENLTAEQKAALDVVGTCVDAVDSCRKAVAEALSESVDAQRELQTACKVLEASQQAFAKDSALMELRIRELEAVNEAIRTTPEEREARIRTEGQKIKEAAEEIKEGAVETAAEDAERAASEQRKAELESEIVALGVKIEQDKAAVASDEARVADADKKVGELTKTVKNALGDAQSAKDNLGAAIARLDVICASVLAEAVSLVAVQLDITEREADLKHDVKVEEIRKVAEDFVAKIDEKNDEDLGMCVSKLADAVLVLAGVPLTLPALALPDHEIKA